MLETSGKQEPESSYDSYVRQEKEKDIAFQQMKELADSVGCRYFENSASRYIEFSTWQDALDFQSHCSEQGFPVKLIEPPMADKSILKQGFKIYPVLEEE